MKAEKIPSNYSSSRLGLTVLVALIVISSTTTVMLFNPAQVLAYSRVIENGNGHSSPPPMSAERSSPSVSSSSTPTIQAPLQIPRTLQSTDLVNSLAFYEVTFITSTTGAIDKIRMDFPAGTGIGAAGLIERVGIGGGTLLKSGSSITYDVTSPVSIPAGTFIRLEMFGIKNPPVPDEPSLTATITTRDSSGNLIDGPTITNAYFIRQIGTNDIAFNAVTTPKIADFAVTSSKLGTLSVTDSKLDTGSVSTSKIENGAVTGNKIAGTTKLIFGTCTDSLPSLSPGATTGEFNCIDPNAVSGDEIVITWSGPGTLPFPVLINSVVSNGQIFISFSNPGSVATAAQSSVELSYIIFKKP